MTLSINLGSSAFIPGVSYTFTFIADFMRGSETVTSEASIALSVNRKPVGGRLQTFPIEGVALESSFTLRTEFWSDVEEDLPFRYTFGYVDGFRYYYYCDAKDFFFFFFYNTSDRSFFFDFFDLS